MENQVVNQAPARKLNTRRGLLKLILLSLVTFGIYPIVAMSGVSCDINIVASKYDGKKTMHFCLLTFIFSWLTFGIAPIVWIHRISNRIGNEAARRGIAYSFSAADFWLWGVIGSIIFVGPFIFYHKFFKCMNLVNADYNVKG